MSMVLFGVKMRVRASSMVFFTSTDTPVSNINSRGSTQISLLENVLICFPIRLVMTELQSFSEIS